MKDIIIFIIIIIFVFIVVKTFINEIVRYGVKGLFKAMLKVLKFVFLILLLPFVIIKRIYNHLKINVKGGDMYNEKWWK